MTNSISLTDENAVLFLENLLLRERLDLKSWDTRQMVRNMMIMNEIVDKAAWNAKEKKNASASVKKEIERLLVIIQKKDATLVDAGHTHLESAITDLRKLVFGF